MVILAVNKKLIVVIYRYSVFTHEKGYMANYIIEKRQNDQNIRENSKTKLQPLTKLLATEFNKRLEMKLFKAGMINNFVTSWTFKIKLSDNTIEPKSTDLLGETVKETLKENHHDLDIDYVRINNMAVDDCADMPCAKFCFCLCICCMFSKLTRYNIYVSFKEKKLGRF